MRQSHGIILRNPTVAQKNSNGAPAISTRNAFGSIQAAIGWQPVGPLEVYLPCGTYTENIVITTSDVRIIGQERACVQLEPADPTQPVILIDATNTGGINFDEVSNLTIRCPAGTSCSDGLKITGRTDIGQMNDFHKFSRLGVYGAFQNGINLAGRTIWTEFENIEVGNTAGNGINIVSSGTTNELTFRNTRTAHNYNYGVYLNNTQTDLANGILFDTLNAEYNGINTGLKDCAGVYLTGVSQVNIQNSYFEGNCQGSTDPHATEVRLTGTYNQSANITNSVFNLQYAEAGIINDSELTTGTYSGNKFTTSSGNTTIYLATSHAMSHVLIGENFNANPILIPDGNGFTHARMLSPFGLDYQPISSVSGNTIDVSTSNGLALYYGPYVIHDISGGHIGQIIYLTAENVSGHILTNMAGGPGQIAFPDGMNRTLNAGEGILLYFDGSVWRPIESSVTTQPRYVGSITTTNSATDSLNVPGITGTAHCLFSARNAAAASLTGTYVTTQNGSVVLNHVPTSGGAFDLFCSSN